MNAYPRCAFFFFFDFSPLPPCVSVIIRIYKVIDVSSNTKSVIYRTYSFNRTKPAKLPLQVRLFRIITQPSHEKRLERIPSDLRIIRRIIYTRHISPTLSRPVLQPSAK